MPRLKVREEIAAPVEAVWAWVGDLERAARWPAVERCEVSGRGPGAVRTLDLVGGERLRERFVELDAVQHRYRSQVLEAGRLPVKDYEYELTISAAGPSRCVVEWDAAFEAAGVAEERARSALRGLYVASAATIREELRA